MKVLVVNNAAPFVHGGAEELANNLVARLKMSSGISAELLRVPFNWEPAERLIDEIILHQGLKLVNVDKVIALKFPAYLIPHANKTIWLLHQFRQAYDLYSTAYSHIGNSSSGTRIVQAIAAADNHCFATCQRLFANSPVTQSRLLRFNAVRSEVLYPPLNDPEQFCGSEYSNYVFAGGRLSLGKRQHLLIEAMQYVRGDIKLIIAGPSEDDAYTEALIRSAQKDDRIEIRAGFRPRDEIAKLVNNALVCAYFPIDEDSLGYVAMEAANAGRPLIVGNDSGGVCDMVVDGYSGFLCSPTPTDIAEKLSFFVNHPERARRLGMNARASWVDRRITWEHTLDRLLS